MGHLTFLTGGARSGKSTFALALGRRSALPVTFIATAPRPDGGDEEMGARIARHQTERSEQPGEWRTIEEPLDVQGAILRAAGTYTILDCLTLWVSNLMWADRTDEEIDRLADEAASAASGVPNPVVVVTNEVGMGIHPDLPLGRRYRDVLGRVNQRWAEAADDALLMVAGRALRLDDPLHLLETGEATR
ncbi:MAG: bifunctional adenosylcobinamide kinase/adenosylcobinamide-phosphate guanylyltransferase [Ilumatobacteraceae bacterium]